MSTDEKWRGLLFGVRRSVRYHRRRSRFFGLTGKWANALNVVFGSTAAASLMAHGHMHDYGAPIASLLVVLVSTADLVVGSSDRARDHSDLARRFIYLESEMVQSPESEDALRGFGAKRLAIEADEPHILKALDVLCHNELAKAMGYGDDQIFPVGWVKRRLAQFVSFDMTGAKPKALPPPA